MVKKNSHVVKGCHFMQCGKCGMSHYVLIELIDEPQIEREEVKAMEEAI